MTTGTFALCCVVPVEESEVPDDPDIPEDPPPHAVNVATIAPHTA
jgi:hypothetical protein